MATNNVFRSSTIFGVLRNSDNTTASPNILANAIFDRDVDVTGKVVTDRINSKTGRIDMSGNIIDISGNTIYLGHTGANVYIKDVLYGGGDVTLAGTNAFTGTNTFNTNLPTSTQTPTSAAQLITKTYADSTYASSSGSVTLAGTNAFTGTNTFNTNLPTSTATPTSAAQLITKTYADSTFAPKASPVLTGTPEAPTAPTITSSTQIATTAFVKNQGYATLASPALTGTPTSPTAAAGTNTTQIATTAFVLGQSFITSAALSAYALLASPTFTGTPAAPTAATSTNTTQIATTAYVKDQGYATLASPALTGNPTATTQLAADDSTRIATTAFVKLQNYLTSAALSGYALLASPTFTGTPAAPTAATITNSTQIATTAFVKNQAYATLASPVLTGTPEAPTAATITNTTQIATTAFVKAQNYLTSAALSGYALLASPVLTGIPEAPTAATSTNTTQIATTAFVKNQGYATLASPTLTGTPAAPTATAGTNTTQIATTAFVLANGVTLSGTNAFTGTNTFNTNLPTSTQTPSSSTQLITKAYADATYPSASGFASLSAANTFTATNNFSTLNSTAIVITDPTTKPASAGGSLRIQHNTSGGSSSIVFPSTADGSEYGYIQYDDNRGSGGENAKLTIGTINDGNDDLYLSPSGSTYITSGLLVGNGAGFSAATEGTILVQGNNGSSGNWRRWNFKVGATSTATSSYNTHRLRILDDTTERLTIDENGRLGIGTAAPSVALDVVGSVIATGDLKLGNLGPGFSAATEGKVRIQGNNGSGGNYRFWDFIVGATSTSTSGYNAHRLRIIDSGTERLTIDENGRLGIGTAAPSVALDVVGSANISGTSTFSGSGSAIRIANANTLDFGYNVAGKEANAGRIGYGVFSAGVALDIVGAGTSSPNRIIQLFDDVVVTRDLFVTRNFNVTGTLAVTGIGIINGATIRTREGSTFGSNLGVGIGVLNSTLTGSNNCAFGNDSLTSLTTGGTNTAVGGIYALRRLTSGSNNVGVGAGALENCTTGNNNTAIGYNALKDITTSNNNVAIGNTALLTLTSGTNNTYIGCDAGTSNITTGSKNTAIGQNAGNHNFSNTTCIGYDSVATFDNQVVLGTASEKVIIKGRLDASGRPLTWYIYSSNNGNAFTPAGRNIGSSFNSPGSIYFNNVGVYGGSYGGEWNTTNGIFTAVNHSGLYCFQLFIFNNGTGTMSRWLKAAGTAIQASTAGSQPYLMFNQAYGSGEGTLTTTTIVYMTIGQTFFWACENTSPNLYYAANHTSAIVTKIY
jgi:hypothetical protein